MKGIYTFNFAILCIALALELFALISPTWIASELKDQQNKTETIYSGLWLVCDDNPWTLSNCTTISTSTFVLSGALSVFACLSCFLSIIFNVLLQRMELQQRAEKLCFGISVTFAIISLTFLTASLVVFFLILYNTGLTSFESGPTKPNNTANTNTVTTFGGEIEYIVNSGEIVALMFDESFFAVYAIFLSGILHILVIVVSLFSCCCCCYNNKSNSA